MDADVVIVGAGPAGCAAAYDLRQAGRSVILLDRHEFPRRKACGGGLTTKTLRALRYSVAPVICCWCDSVRVSLRFSRSHLLQAPGPICAMTERSRFDEFCWQHTVAAGVEFRRIGHISAVTESAHAVAIDTDLGSIRASFLVGADGANSQVRKFSDQFRPQHWALAVESTLRPPRADSVEMAFDFGIVPEGYGWVFPKGDHVGIGLYTLSDTHLTPARLADYAARRFPGCSLETTIGHRLALGGENYRPTSRRIFLVGDAAGLADPLLGEGIYNAIVSGQAAAAAIVDELSHAEPSLAAFRRRLRPIQRDLRSSGRSSRWFYRQLSLGYSLLVCPLVRRALARGFARGWTLREIKKYGWLLAVRKA